MVLIQVLLPTVGATPDDGLAALAQPRAELAERFRGITAYLRSPGKGLWTANCDRQEGGLVGVGAR